MSNSSIRRNEYGKAADQTSPKRFVQRCRAEQGWGIFVDAAFEKEAGATLVLKSEVGNYARLDVVRGHLRSTFCTCFSPFPPVQRRAIESAGDRYKKYS